MQTIKSFVARHLGVFSPIDILDLGFALCISAVVGFVLLALYRKVIKEGKLHTSLVVYSMGTALLTAVVKHSLPLAIAAMTVLLVLRPNELRAGDQLYLFLALALGVICGAGASLVAMLAMPVLAVALLFVARKPR